MAKRTITASEMGKIGGPIGGRRRMRQMSAEERRAFSRAGLRSLWKNIQAQLPEGNWMLIADAAKRLSIKVPALRYLSEKGRISYKEVKYGKRTCRIFNEKDLLAYKKQHQN